MLRCAVVLAVLAVCSTAVADVPATGAVYPWHTVAPAGVDRLDGRYAPPAGFARVAVAPRSFGAFVRSLPLAPAGAKVVDFTGRPLHGDGHHPNIAAIVDIDIGTSDLQQCADAIIRMHAEWRYGLGERDLAYRAVSGQRLAYRSWLDGERAVIDGKNLALRHTAPARADSHPAFRAWLDEVFRWAGTPSVARDAKKVERQDLAPGDLFVLTGSPFGHGVLVLDVARDDRDRVALLLGQSYIPAQSFQVLQPDARGPWFVVEPGDAAVKTPFWQAFPFDTSLKRL